MKFSLESMLLCTALLFSSGTAIAQDTPGAPAAPAPTAPIAPSANEDKDVHVKIDLSASGSDEEGRTATLSIDTSGADGDASDDDGPVGRAIRTGVAEMLEEHLLDRDSLSEEEREEVREAIAELRGEMDGAAQDVERETRDDVRREVQKAIRGKIKVKSGDSDGEDDFGAFEAAAAITAITFSLGMPIIIVAMILYFAYRRRRLAHDTINQYLSSGKEIPPEIMQNLFKDAAGKPATPRTNLHKGTINTSIGLGMVIGFNAIDAGFLAAIGFIFLLVGLAQILIWKLEQGKQGDQTQV